MKITNKLNLPQALVAVAERGVRKPEPGKLHVTQLIDSPMVRRLRMEHWDEIEQDVCDLLQAMQGSAVHAYLEKGLMSPSLEAWDTVKPIVRQLLKDQGLEIDNLDVKVRDILSREAEANENVFCEMNLEQKFDYKGDEVLIKGTVDFPDNGIVTDWKNTSVWAVIFGKPEWREQLNVYAHMLEEQGHKVNGLRVVAFLKDWNRRDAAKDPSYPQHPIAIIDQVLWNKEFREQYILDRLALHADKDYVCTPEDRWYRPGKIAVKKTFNSKRAMKLFDEHQEVEATEFCTQKQGVLEVRPGTNARCDDYCPVNTACPWYKANVLTR